jgi:hypothetical protein
MNGKTSSVFQRLLAATLLVSGLGAIAAPAFADGTAAGTSIDNTATATYDDPANPNTPFNSTSNTVKVTVAEVAGVTVTPLSTIDVNGGTVLPSDVVNYEYKVTNVGNDTTGFYIPGTPVVTGPGTATAVQIVAYIAPDGTRTAITPITIAGAGQNTKDLGLPPLIAGAPVGVIPPGYSLVLNIPTTITATASSGSDVVVRIGNTGSNDNGTTTQNVDSAAAAATKTDRIYTVDYTGTYTGEAVGSPAVEKEGSGTQTVKVGSTSQALATILKTRTSYSAGLSPTFLNDDVIGYGLELKVESTAPAGSVGVTPGKLAGTTIKFTTGPDEVRILLSDVVPAQTKLIDETVANIAAPAGWQAVYTTDDPATTSALAARWTRTFTASATRIGFIPTATGVVLTEGTVIKPFTFNVVTSGVSTTATTANIANIAQVFGQTNGAPVTAPLVYDESGDQQPSNFNENGTPGTTAGVTPSSVGLPYTNPNAIPSGVAVPATDGVDNTNDNTGKGPGGEDNVTTIAAAGTILNGPKGVPGAVGPNNNNDDFTNRSTPIPAGTIPLTPGGINPDPITFTNSLSNPSSTAPLTSVLVVPDLSGFVPGPGEVLPLNGTLVTLTYGTSTAVYEYISTPITGYPNGTFIFKSGSAITIPTLAPGQVVDYTVSVDLPTGTLLSTDTGNGFSIPIFAFKDVNGDSRPGTLVDEPVQNRTINRVYTGFLKLVKEARILDTDGATLIDNQNWTQDSSALTGKGAKGRFIEYRISYKNISIAPTGTGNITLDAKNIAITEDGANGGNSWAKDTDNNGVIDTSHVISSVSVTYGGLGSVIFSPSGEQTGTTAITDVTKYVHSPGVVIQPQATGTFTFKRKIN